MTTGMTGYIPVGSEMISSVLLGVAGTDIEFSSIPAGYKFLFLRGRLGTTNANEQIKIKFNTNVPTTSQFISNVGATIAGGAGDGSNNFGTSGATAPQWIILNAMITNSPSYVKTYVSETGGLDGHFIFSGYWNSVAEINDILIQARFANFAIGTYVELWGTK